MGWSVIGRPAAQALERFVHGSVQGLNDLELVEVALRAVVLHPFAAVLDPRSTSLADDGVGLFRPFPQPPLSFSSEDSSIPPSLMAQVGGPMDGLRDFVRSRLYPIEGVDPPVPPTSGPGETVLHGGEHKPVPGIWRVLQGMSIEQGMETTLLVGYLGGSSLLAMPEEYDTVDATLDTFYVLPSAVSDG